MDQQKPCNLRHSRACPKSRSYFVRYRAGDSASAPGPGERFRTRSVQAKPGHSRFGWPCPVQCCTVQQFDIFQGGITFAPQWHQGGSRNNARLLELNGTHAGTATHVRQKEKDIYLNSHFLSTPLPCSPSPNTQVHCGNPTIVS